MERRRELSTVLTVCVTLVTLCGPAHAQYGGGTGDPNNPYLIHTSEQMNAIGANPNHWDKHFKLMADIDLSAYTGTKFNIIGRITIRGGRSFTGVFDGNDHTVTSFTLSSDDKRCGGLFECVAGSQAEIRNLGLLRPHVDVPIGHSAGAIVGRLDEGALVNCHVVGGTVSGRNNIGGLVGVNQAGTIDNCYAATTVSGTNYVGGLVGENHSDTVIGCHGEGHARGNDYVGGLLGINFGTVTNCDATGTVDGRTYTGGLVGYNDHGTLLECHATGNVTGSEYTGGLLGFNWEATVAACYAVGAVTGTDWTGGLVGYLRHGTVTSCYATGPATGEDWVGGLIGACVGGYYGPAEIDNSYATGDVNGDASVGGLVGSLSVRWLVDCYATGAVTGADHVGGLVGYYFRGEVSHSFWNIETTGQQESDGGIGLTTVEMMMAETFLGWGGCDRAGLWTIDEGHDYPRLWWEERGGNSVEIPSLLGLLEGEGTRDNPFLIYTPEQFRLIGFTPCVWDKHLELMADIDLSAYTSDQLHMIGLDFYRGSFVGVFDGNGHTISHFHYNAVDDTYVGLFGRVAGPEAEIRNLGLVAPTVDGGDAIYTGALTGYLYEGTIRNCFVESAWVCGDDTVGGLVGRNDDHIVGCYSTGSVWGDERVGGLTGINSSIIAYCYATTSVTGTSQVGGLVGSTSGTGRRIVDCYSAGAVEGEEEIGGLVGYGGGSIESSFWNVETSEQDQSAGGTGFTDSDLQNTNVFVVAGWDFFGSSDGYSDVWDLDVNTGYPILWWQVPEVERPDLPVFSGGTGASDDPYQISTGEQLNRIGHNPRLMASHFLLANGIDLAGTSFCPIGNEGLPFTASFDGNGMTIANCVVSPEWYCTGFCGHLRGMDAHIKNLELIELSIDARWCDEMGALVGRLRQGTLSHCSVASGSVRGDERIGGLVGYLDKGAISNCVAGNIVAGDERVGGLVGENQSGTIVEATSGGSVSGSIYTGGVAGQSEGTIKGCHAMATVVGRDYVGGVTGWNRGPMTKCDSAGPTTGVRYVGGLVGRNSSSLSDCAAMGEVSGTEFVGGLAGYHSGISGYYSGASSTTTLERLKET